jgi:hypothetical protein
MRANAPKPTQQSNANRSKGIKTRHIGSFPGIEMRDGATNATRRRTINPVGRELTLY